MSTGILILRLALAAILFAHASQKTFGWFQGLGIETMSKSFAQLGLRPGRLLVTTAAVTEACAAVSLTFGFLLPLGAAASAGAMLVAGMTMQMNAGRFWNVAGGGEYPYVLSVLAVTLGFIGPGAFSLDRLIASAAPSFGSFDSGVIVGVIVACVAVLSAIPFRLTVSRERRARLHVGDAA